MGKYFVVAYTIIGILVLLVIGANFGLIDIEGFRLIKNTLRKGYALELDGGQGWLNCSGPLRLSDLEGKVVLLNFWTYCSINCRHTIPDTKRLEAKYADELVVIGVHTGKFTNESKLENIRQAVLRLEIDHPVVNDAAFTIWHKYNINSWPVFVLIDPKGYVIGYYHGEGHYDEMDARIGQAVAEYKANGLLNTEPISFTQESPPNGKELLFPGSVTADEAANRLFIADSNHNRILITDLDGRLIETIGNGTSGRVDGKFSDVSFNHPQGMAYHDGALYVADTDNHLIRKVDVVNRRVTTIAGSGAVAGYMQEGGQGSDIPMNSPWDIVVVEDNLYIAMAGSHQIWKMDLAVGRIDPFAGDCRQTRVDGPLLASSLAQPSGITANAETLYFADSETSSIRSATVQIDGAVDSIIGLELFLFGDRDGGVNDARLQHPLGIVSHNGLLYIADTFNHKIKVVDTKNQTCRTIFGTGDAGLSDGKESRFHEPRGLTIADNKLYIADTNNHAIRVADLRSGEVSTLHISE